MITAETSFQFHRLRTRTEPNPYHQITQNEYEPKILGSFPSLIFASQRFWGQKVKDQSRTASAWAGVNNCELRSHDSVCLSVCLSPVSRARLVTSCGWVNSAREATACHQVFVNNRDPHAHSWGGGTSPERQCRLIGSRALGRHGTQYTLNS